MEIALLVIALVAALVILGRSPVTQRFGDAEEARFRSEYRGADVSRQFGPPRNHGGGLL